MRFDSSRARCWRVECASMIFGFHRCYRSWFVTCEFGRTPEVKASWVMYRCGVDVLSYRFPLRCGRGECAFAATTRWLRVGALLMLFDLMVGAVMNKLLSSSLRMRDFERDVKHLMLKLHLKKHKIIKNC